MCHSSQSTWLHTGEEGKLSSYVSLTSSGHGKNLASRKAGCRLQVAGCSLGMTDDAELVKCMTLTFLRLTFPLCQTRSGTLLSNATKSALSPGDHGRKDIKVSRGLF